MSARYHAMTELLELFPNNPVILEAVIKTEDHINTVARNGGKIMVSISGGSDSDIMLERWLSSMSLNSMPLPVRFLAPAMSTPGSIEHSRNPTSEENAVEARLICLTIHTKE